MRCSMKQIMPMSRLSDESKAPWSDPKVKVFSRKSKPVRRDRIKASTIFVSHLERMSTSWSPPMWGGSNLFSGAGSDARVRRVVGQIPPSPSAEFRCRSSHVKVRSSRIPDWLRYRPVWGLWDSAS
ncbi:hypothetical protein CDAR_562731 [Caerostris darwini]|uniref:Uncharacterized protein n=1 Tax=Caerostris darwini TaxID=1538125 RepID=A0AAV4X7N9_9ARAC|nr:hypothetical protein CDAR_562731 [Caerostris darwini]